MQSPPCGPRVRLRPGSVPASGLGLALVVLLAGELAAQRASAPASVAPGVAIPGEVEPPPPPEGTPGSLNGEEIPPVFERITGNPLSSYIVDEEAAIALGKALFWDLQAGSDGQACASCHFHAGADNRVANQLSPGLLGGNAVFDRIRSTGDAGPNLTLGAGDFPFHVLEDPSDRNSTVLFDTDDVFSSQGVFPTEFDEIIVGSAAEDCEVLGAGEGGDPLGFQVGGTNVRRVEPRNTPTVINAVFNHRNFWDGRATTIFNGVDPFGRRNQDARVLEIQKNGTVIPIQVEFENSSLASQAVGPLLSDFEMSCSGRTFPDAAKKLLHLRPLAFQLVAVDDSVLGTLSLSPEPGLATRYAELIMAAFDDRFWDSDKLFDEDLEEVVEDLVTDEEEEGRKKEKEEEEEEDDVFTLMEVNFSLFWGLSIQAYEATLVSDDSPFDRWAEGRIETLGESAMAGLEVFMDEGKCISCHNTSMFSKASTLHLLSEANEEGLVERMLTYETEHTYLVRGEGGVPGVTGDFRFEIDAEGPAQEEIEGSMGHIRIAWTKEHGGAGGAAGLDAVVGQKTLTATFEVVDFVLDVDGDPMTRDAGLQGRFSDGPKGTAEQILLHVVDGVDGPDTVTLDVGGRIFCDAEVAEGDMRILQPALYDNGFYNIGIRVNGEDLGLGGEDQWGNPFSFSRQYVEMLQGEDVPDPFEVDPCSFEIPFDTEVDTVFFPGGFTKSGGKGKEGGDTSCAAEPSNVGLNQASIRTMRTAVDGAFKTATLRNIELTGPYFHNGGQATLEQVVEFYNRGGDFSQQNRDELAPDIRPLGLSQQQMDDLVAFMKTLTDDRVANEIAPFDHPQLFIPDGHPGDHLFVVDSDGDGQADASFFDDPSVFLEVPAVGRGGRPDAGLPPLAGFLRD